MVDESGEWDWCRISPWLPKETLEKIATMLPPWQGTGSYWCQIWRLSVPQCVRVFIWLVFHRRLLTNAERGRRNLVDSDRCSVCNTGTESIEHALRLCPQVRQVWEAMIASDKLSVFDSLPFDTWLLQCFNSIAGIGVDNVIWSTQFAMTCWLIWKAHCTIVFDGAGLYGVGLARYGRILAAEFADTHACRTGGKPHYS
ncbi:hypothetical protein GQ457_07G013980 [Hibiscus cannabinus]